MRNNKASGLSRRQNKNRTEKSVITIKQLDLWIICVWKALILRIVRQEGTTVFLCFPLINEGRGRGSAERDVEFLYTDGWF